MTTSLQVTRYATRAGGLYSSKRSSSLEARKEDVACRNVLKESSAFICCLAKLSTISVVYKHMTARSCCNGFGTSSSRRHFRSMFIRREYRVFAFEVAMTDVQKNNARRALFYQSSIPFSHCAHFMQL